MPAKPRKRPNIVREAVAAAGGLQAVSVHCRVSYQAIQKWIRSRRVPAGRVIDLERACKAKFTRYQLRPDIYPKEAIAA